MMKIAATVVPPMQVVQALELAVAALSAGGTDMNVPTMPGGQPLTLDQLRGDGSESLQRRTEMDYKKLSKNLKDAKWTNAGMTDDQSLEWDASDAITDLLARAETAEERCKELEARCKRLDEARERANEATSKWEGMYRMALERAENAERERDAAISDLTYIARTYPVDLCDDLVCQYCKHYQNVNTVCPGWTEDDCFEWRGKKEE